MSYTFKDDGASLTYYREYNKEVGTGDKTLVGNWVEERALRESVTTGRYKLWVNPKEDPLAPQRTFTKFTTRPDTLDTYRRTVVHSDHTPSAEFITSNQVPDPGYAVYVNPTKGAREALLEARARELSARTQHVEPELPPQYQSTYKQDFVNKDLPTADTLGRRVMMTQNMQDIKGNGDFLWRKEHDIVSRHLVTEGSEGGPNQTFTMSGVRAARSFGKDTTFSTPIAIYEKGAEKV
jgi:hypothetical protein